MSGATDLAAQATAAGASALFVSMVGVEPQGVIWSLIGCVIGVVLAKPAGTFYSVALFMASMFTCALCATMVASHWFHGEALVRNFFAVMFGAGFHPALQAFFSSIPAVVEACKNFVVRRIGGGQ